METITEKKLWRANAEFQALARDDLQQVFASGPCHWLWRRLAKIGRNYWEDTVTVTLVVTPQGGLHRLLDTAQVCSLWIDVLQRCCQLQS